jgi:thymidylate synthase (FAD)
METYSEPKTYLIAEPKLNWDGINEFFKDYNLSWTEKQTKETDADKLIEFAGRICYVSFGNKQGRKTNWEYIENLLLSGHGSVLEHANYTFLTTKASRGFTHEMIRHRAGFAYSQESTQYINYSPNTGLINIPEK